MNDDHNPKRHPLDDVRAGKANAWDDDAWKEQRLYGKLPEWYATLDADLQQRLAPFLWVEELNTGAWQLREHEWWNALRDFAVTIQAQRAKLRERDA